jgi:oxygen-independent coproporphyrinogen-3 oxidase
MSGIRRKTDKKQGHFLQGTKSAAAPGLYIHTPFCRKKCDYCDFYSVTASDDMIGRYTAALKAHLTEASAHVHSAVETVYFGGGTPAMLGAKNLHDLLKLIKKHFAISAKPEITIELNPESTDRKLLK